MPKLKTRKASIKRYKIKSPKTFLRNQAFKSHLLRKKSNRQKRKLSRTTFVSLRNIKALKLMLPYR